MNVRGSAPHRLARSDVALLSLALGGFAIGCNEFLSMGILHQISAEADAAAAASRPDSAAAAASIFVWGYAAGVVIGAPVLGLIARRFDARRFLAASLAAMGLLTAGAAVVEGFAPIVVLRVLSGIPHAAYLGVAAIVAAGLLGREHAARGVAVVIGGLTIANIVGVPLGTWLGQVAGWRWCYAAIAALFVVSVVGTLLTVDTERSRPPAPMEWRGLLDGGMWRLLIVFSFVNAGMFAVLTFISPLATSFSGIDARLLPFVVATAGVGMTIGNYIGGSAADRRPSFALALGLCSAACGFAVMAIPGVPATAFVGVALIAFALGELGPLIQTRLMRATGDNPQLGSSMNSFCANLGSVVGGAVAGVSVATAGASAAVWVGIALSGAGWATLGFWALVRRRTQAHKIIENVLTSRPS